MFKTGMIKCLLRFGKPSYLSVYYNFDKLLLKRGTDRQLRAVTLFGLVGSYRRSSEMSVAYTALQSKTPK